MGVEVAAALVFASGVSRQTPEIHCLVEANEPVSLVLGLVVRFIFLICKKNSALNSYES